MIIIDIESIEADKTAEVVLKKVFNRQIKDKSNFTFGIVQIPPGARIPREGAGVHEGDEYSIVVKGEIHAVSGGKEYRLKQGQAALIPARESHWAINDSDDDCEIVWVLLEL